MSEPLSTSAVSTARSLRAELGPGFRMGVATSAYQIEGARHLDGRLDSIWDTFSHTPGKTKLGHTGDVACDHYQRLEEDLDLLAWLGVDTYRFSIAWPRVIPEGRGAVNQAGLDFYERLVDGLLARGIEPCATLYHWDLPQALEPEGGWLSRDTTQAFAEYAQAVATRLGDRVALWLTHNEPWCQAFLGYEQGLFAPGHKSLSEALLCAHHLLVSHGLAVQALRACTGSPIGIAPNYLPVHAASQSEEDVAAAARLDGNFNRWFLDPLVGRGYPEDMVQFYGPAVPALLPGDLELIAQPIDVLGINYYERGLVRDSPKEGLLHLSNVREPERPRTADREIYPEGIRETLQRVHRDYPVSRLVITENGAAFPGEDSLGSDGEVADDGRVEFFEQHLRQLALARAEGIPVDSYFAWSLMDNFEWSEGYTLRYGIVHVDFESQKRTPKRSAHFLRQLARGQ